MTLMIVVGTGMLDETGCVNVCFWTVIRPDDVAAMACISSYTQAVAAPIPRTGSVWLDAVCRVPNWTSRKIVAWMRAGSTCASRANNPSSGGCGKSAGPEAARAAPESRGTATALAAEADRNFRRVAPALLGSLLGMPPTQRYDYPGVNRVHPFATSARISASVSCRRRGAPRPSWV